MLNNEDILKIIKAIKEVFTTKDELEGFKEELRKSFSDLQSSVDAY